MKYAFAGRNNGSITVSVTRMNIGVSLVIEDNGVGMPESMILKARPVWYYACGDSDKAVRGHHPNRACGISLTWL